MPRRPQPAVARPTALLLAALLALVPSAAHAAEQVTLRSGFSLLCARHEAAGDKVRLFFAPAPGSATENYLDVAPGSIAAVESVPDPPPAAAPASTHPAEPAADLPTLLAHAGAGHRIDAELLASVVHAESGGRARAVSRTGARGLMQLMPATAAALGVHDSFAPADNVEGGTTYLDALLVRYRDNLALALAAYNAGPGAVDRYHGVPPFPETRAYVARVIAEFNRRKSALARAGAPTAAASALLSAAAGR